MYKVVFFLLSVSGVTAATLATVNCTGSGTVADPSSAACGNNGYGAPTVFAWAGSNQARVDSSGLGSAHAVVTALYEFTVTGGTGSGFFAPCLSALAAGGSSTAVFGPFGVSAAGGGGHGICPLTVAGTLPFTDGVPQDFQFRLEAQGSGNETAEADFGGILFQAVGAGSGFTFYDANGNRISDASFTLVDLSIPEPGSFACCALLLSVLIQIKRKRVTR